MSLQTLLNQIDELQAAIEAEGKFDPEVLKKINYKFRLDWNYHSNAMEGNSLTKEETRSVMIDNVSVRDKPLKDVLEMRGHDQVVNDILKIGKGELNLSEKRIKEIHKAIIHEDDASKQQKIGQWKTENNEVINYKHEKFEFLDYQEVPEAMHQLLNWLSTQIEQLKAEKNKLHPTLIAFDFHLKYLTIHPFYDGNGRTARVLMNLILISFGYPPVIIKKAEEEIYHRYLADVQGYGGDPNLYYEFMCKLLIHSQELVLKAIRGESIEEPDDLDKGIELLKRTLAISPDDLAKSPEVLNKLWIESLSQLKNGFIELHKKFQVLFEKSTIEINAISGNRTTTITELGSQRLLFSMPERLRKLDRIAMISEFSQMRNHPLEKRFIIINITFSNFDYLVSNEISLKVQKKYSEPYTKTEIDDFIFKTGKFLLDDLNQVIDGNQK